MGLGLRLGLELGLRSELRSRLKLGLRLGLGLGLELRLGLDWAWGTLCPKCECRCKLKKGSSLFEPNLVIRSRSLALSRALFPLSLSPHALDAWTRIISALSNARAGLREEFEMDSRLRTIESKLNMLQQNTNFFIEMLHNQKRLVTVTSAARVSVTYTLR